MKILLIHNKYGKFSGEEAVVESQIKLSGGDILAQSMNETIDSYDDYKIPAIEQILSGYVQKIMGRMATLMELLL